MSRYAEDDPDFVWEEPPPGDEWLTEYYDDDYPDVQHSPDLEDEFNFASMPQPSLSHILEECIEPVVSGATLHVGKLLLWCFIFRLTTQLSPLPAWLSHLISCVSGTVALVHFFYINAAFPIVLSLLCYLVLQIVHRVLGCYRGVASAIACVVFNSACELFVTTSVDWHTVRGAQMILTMKLISLGFDLDIGLAEREELDRKKRHEAALEAEREKEREREAAESNKKVRQRDLKRNRRFNLEQTTDEEEKGPSPLGEMPTFIAYMGYALCPGTVVFGPWVKYEDYLKLYSMPRWNFTWLIKIFLSLLYGMTFLTISTCWNPWMIPDGMGKWSTAYRDAMSFRASHYFVCYISEASAVMAGYGGTNPGPHAKWDVQVAEPVHVEVPRSLEVVAKSWNKPMSVWLSTYCFKVARPYGKYLAIFATYFFSTMIHGFYPQIGAVLFSLALYTYAESTLRSKMARIFDASVSAIKPEEGSTRVFKYKEGQVMVILVNFAFGVLACFNLAYLGVMFDQDKSSTEGYSIKHTLQKWSELGFISHGIMFFILFLSQIL